MTAQKLEYTGERMVPGAADYETFWAHIARYRFACRYVKGHDVLDVACGEGYGSAGLAAAGARSVVGIDVALEAVAHAKRKYGIDAREGCAESLPLADASADVITSFETIEHVTRPTKFLDECVRVLRPGGKLVISTPNADIYQLGTPNNPFHCSEMSFSEFRNLMESKFENVIIYGQNWPVPWYLRTRGFGRLAKILSRFTRDQFVEKEADDCKQAVRLCSKRQGMLEQALFTNAVRLRNRSDLEASIFIVAVASKRH